MKDIKIGDLETPSECVALRRVPHYALIKEKPCVLIGSFKVATYRSMDGLIVEADIFNPAFQVDVVEITEDTYRSMGGKESCVITTLYDKLLWDYPEVDTENFKKYRKKFLEELKANYGEQFVVCIKNLEAENIHFKEGYRYKLSHGYLYDASKKLDVNKLFKNNLFNNHFKLCEGSNSLFR